VPSLAAQGTKITARESTSEMFTGIIEEIGVLSSIEPLGSDVRLTISCRKVLEDARRGDSIAVDGCCLTVETIEGCCFTAYASPETLKKTSLGDRKRGDGVNLERALAFGARLGGHLVSGHVDTTGIFRSATKSGKAIEIRVEAPREILDFSVPKGSIAIDGISLTIVDLTARDFSCWIIPETWERTTLGRKRPGDRVNLESDLIGKYVNRWMETRHGISPDTNREKDRRISELLGGGNWGATP
jgi:riboflavin synthase